MGIPIFFGLFVIFLIFFNLKIQLHERKRKQSTTEFLEREHKSNFVRKKSLESMNYISPSLDDLPLLSAEHTRSLEEKKAYNKQLQVQALVSQPMLDLKGKSNTDLKLEYGTSNLERLIQYEQNYQRFLFSLLEWAKALQEANRINDAIQVLEKGVEIGSDLSQNYTLLAELYETTNQQQKILPLEEILKQKQEQNIILKKTLQKIQDIQKISEVE
jgi:hypothetical protein